MSGKATYAVQVFERRGTALLTGPRLTVVNAATAKIKAAEVAECSGGAIALCLNVDDDGSIWVMTVLATFGEAPDGWAEWILDGEDSSIRDC